MAVLRTGLGLQAAITALFAIVLLILPGTSTPLYVSLSGFAMVVILFASAKLSDYLKVFVSVYGIGYLFRAGAKQLAASGFLPETLAALLPPCLRGHGRGGLRRHRVRNFPSRTHPRDHSYRGSVLRRTRGAEPGNPTVPFLRQYRRPGRTAPRCAFNLHHLCAGCATTAPELLVPRPLQRAARV